MRRGGEVKSSSLGQAKIGCGNTGFCSVSHIAAFFTGRAKRVTMFAMEQIMLASGGATVTGDTDGFRIQ